MLPTLFYIPCEVAGWRVFGFGLLLTFWAAACGGTLVWLVWRQGLSADTWGSLPVMLIVAAVIAWVLPALCDARGLPIRGYGVMILLAVVAGMGLAVWRAKRVGVHPEFILTLAFWMILPGIVCARAVYVTEYWSEQYWPVYLQNGLAALLGAVVNVANGGLVVFGALLGGVMGLVAFRLKYRVPLLATADLMAPSLILGQAIGRIGCLLNGCCFGGPCELPWAVTFPWNSPAQVYQVMHGQLDLYGMKLADGRGGLPAVAEVQPGSAAERAGLKPGEQIRAINHMPVDSAKEACWALLQSPRGEPSLLVERAGGLPSLQLPVPQPLPRSLPVHPTQLYSLIEGLLLCLLLLVYDRFRRRDGELLAVLLTLHPIGRFLVEAIRTDEPAIWGTGMHLSQNLSLLILAVAVGLWIYVLRRPPGLAYNGV